MKKGKAATHRAEVSTRHPLLREVFDWIESIAFALVVVVVIFSFLFRIVMVDGASMVPTLHNQDRLILTNGYYDPQPMDVVVCQINGANRNRPIIKRVIAVAGQTVDIDFDRGIVIVDGKELDEDSYTRERTFKNPKELEFPIEVPEGRVFVLGDNRNESLDSRYREVGFVKLADVKGKAVFCIFPFDNIGKIK